MYPFYASPQTASEGFAAAAGCKKPEEEPSVQPECPDNRVDDGSIPDNLRMVSMFAAGSEVAGKEVMQSLAGKGSDIITAQQIGNDPFSHQCELHWRYCAYCLFRLVPQPLERLREAT